jgi:hypothetical protein
MRIHDLRQTCVTLLLVQGVHARVVMETLGHSQSSFTLDTDSDVLPGGPDGQRVEEGSSRLKSIRWRSPWMSNS